MPPISDTISFFAVNEPRCLSSIRPISQAVFCGAPTLSNMWPEQKQSRKISVRMGALTGSTGVR